MSIIHDPLSIGFSAASTTNLIRKLSNNETMAVDLYIAMGEESLTPGVDFTFEEIYVVTSRNFVAREPSSEKNPDIASDNSRTKALSALVGLQSLTNWRKMRWNNVTGMVTSATGGRLHVIPCSAMSCIPGGRA